MHCELYPHDDVCRLLLAIRLEGEPFACYAIAIQQELVFFLFFPLAFLLNTSLLPSAPELQSLSSFYGLGFPSSARHCIRENNEGTSRRTTTHTTTTTTTGLVQFTSVAHEFKPFIIEAIIILPLFIEITYNWICLPSHWGKVWCSSPGSHRATSRRKEPSTAITSRNDHGQTQ